MRALLLTLSLCYSATVLGASIWHVQGEQEWYLFGTIHVLRPDAYPLPASYQTVLDRCTNLWLEVDLDALTEPEILLQVRSIMQLPTGATLKTQISAKAYRRLTLLADRAGKSLADFTGLKPWAVANVLALMLFEQRGFVSEQGLDLHLAQQAKTREIPTLALETVIQQMTLLDELAAAYPDDFITFSTNDLDRVDQLVAEMVHNWQQGDVEALYRLADFKAYPAIEDAMLNQRNNDWMRQFEQASDQTSPQCVAVGALHMAGESGLLAQFKRAGYRVRQVTAKMHEPAQGGPQPEPIK